MKVMPSISLGQVVQSKQGKDDQLFYVIVGINGNSLMLVNGRERTMKNPKKKNIRHVKIYQCICPTANNLERNQLLSNEAIRGFLNKYKPDNL